MLGEEKEKAPMGAQMPIEQAGMRMLPALKAKLEELADKKGMNFNSFVLSVLHQYIERQ